MAWFTKKPSTAAPGSEAAPSGAEQGASRAKALWAKCEECDEIIYKQELEKNLNVCPVCDHHMPWTARARLAGLLDEGSFEEFDQNLEPQDPLGFTDAKKYRDRLKTTRKNISE